MNLSPELIHFSHDSISCRFRCGRHIEDTYMDLRDGRIHVSIIPRITVSYVDGEWFAYNGNRRLWVFKTLAIEGRLHQIRVEVTFRPIPRRCFTTQCDGRAIEVRTRPDLDFPPPHVDVPRFSALFQDGSTQQSFVDSASGCIMECLALSYETSGYFYITAGGDWKRRGIPEELDVLITLKLLVSVNPTYVALGPDERYFVKFDDGSENWRASDGFTKAVKKLGRRDTVQAVAFGPRGGWWMRTSKGSQWDNLPRHLNQELEDADCCARFVSISQNGRAWFVKFDNDNYCWEGLDRDCSREINKQGRRIYRITFGSRSFLGEDDWVLEFS
eukprot:Skav220270  [mRNA]  locus=scaffold3532:57220:58209:- [translate_table: standard]